MRRTRGATVSSQKLNRILQMFRILFIVVTWGFVALTFGLAIYSATVMDERLDEAKADVKLLRERSKLRTNTYALEPYSEDDDAFLRQYQTRCPDEAENMQMNAPGGFTNAANCGTIRDTLEWPTLTNVARKELCESYRAYSADTPLQSGWGRCIYDADIKGCTFVFTESTDTDTAGCVDEAQQASYNLLQGSTTYPYSSRYTSSRVVVVNNDAYNWLT